MKCQYIKPLKKLGLLNVSVSDASELTVPVALLTNAIEIWIIQQFNVPH